METFENLRKSLGYSDPCPHFYIPQITIGYFPMNEEELTLPVRGGGLFSPPLTFLFVASKRMYMLVRNFLTFLIYQK